MEEKHDRVPPEKTREVMDDAMLEMLWADQESAVNWKKKSPFGQPAAPQTSAVPQAEAAPKSPAPIEEVCHVPVAPPGEVVLQAAPSVVEEPQPTAEMPGNEKEPWPLEGTAVSWKRKMPFSQPAASATPKAEEVSEPPALAEKVAHGPVAPPEEALSIVRPLEPKPEPTWDAEKKPAKQRGLWETKKQPPAIEGVGPGSVSENSGNPRTEKVYPASLWRREKSSAVGKESRGVSATVWGKHSGQEGTRSSVGSTIWGKKAPAAERVCPKCGTLNPADAHFCCMCRAPLQEKTCPTCGKVIALAQARYCPFCGEDL